MKSLRKLVLVAAIASGFSVSLSTVANAGYWIRNCNMYTCWDSYIPTCGWYYDGWGRSYWACQ